MTGAERALEGQVEPGGRRPGDASADLRCRDEILQAMYWMRGEALHAEADVMTLRRFLAVEPAILEDQLAALRRSGHLEERGGRYALTELGLREGGRRFADEFAELQALGHAACPPGCPHCEPAHRGDDCRHCVAFAPASAAW